MIRINSKLTTYFVLGLCTGIILTFGLLKNGPGKSDQLATSIKSHNTEPEEVILMELQYAADFSDDRVLVGASHNIFVGKVLEQTGTKERSIGPETQFKVVVLDNVKGDLRGIVTVNQQGGYKDGKLYLVEGDTFTENSDSESLLQNGTTYLFTTRYNEIEDWYTINSFPEANKVLTSEIKSDEEIKSQIAKDVRVNSLKAAYITEIPLQVDIQNDRTFNSYAAVHNKNISPGGTNPESMDNASSSTEGNTLQKEVLVDQDVTTSSSSTSE